jgi:hypothetical protein
MPFPRILFLDIDGVLNHAGSVPIGDGFVVEPDIAQRLNEITTMTGAGIVITSLWRRQFAVPELQQILRRAGVIGEVVGVTPDLRASHGYGVERGWEIGHWLQEHFPDGGVTFAILDDNPIGPLSRYLVPVSFSTGLADAQVTEVVRRLKSPTG